MFEGSHGRDVRPSKGPFRAVDETHSNVPKLQQARRVTSSSDHGPSVRHRIRNIALALGIATGGISAVAIGLNEMSKPPKETYQTYEGQLKQIDTRQYLLQVHIDGLADLNIRSDAVMPTFDERQEGRDNVIKLDDIATINGLPWDGRTPVVIENSPVVMAMDPSNRVLETQWLAVTLGKKSPLGDVTETVGFIAQTDSTAPHLAHIGDAGETIRASFENGQIYGKNEFGEKIIPPENVGLASIASESIIAQAATPR